MPSAIGIDVGATKVAMALVDASTGGSRDWESFATSVEEGPLRFWTSACSAASALRKAISAIGIGVCEIVGRGGGITTASSIDWRGFDIVDLFARLGPVHIESDVRAAAIAEARFGAGRGLASFLYVNAGSGTSSCFVVDGEPLVGARGAASLIGAGPLGTEALAGGIGIAQRYGAPSVEDVVRAAERGDVRASGILREGGAALGDAIAFAANLLDPDAVIIGGGVALNAREFRGALETAMRRHIWLEDTRGLPLLDAELASHAGVIGAAAAALDHAREGVT